MVSDECRRGRRAGRKEGARGMTWASSALARMRHLPHWKSTKTDSSCVAAAEPMRWNEREGLMDMARRRAEGRRRKR